jgi:hypothetical protein
VLPLGWKLFAAATGTPRNHIFAGIASQVWVHLYAMKKHVVSAPPKRESISIVVVGDGTAHHIRPAMRRSDSLWHASGGVGKTSLISSLVSASENLSRPVLISSPSPSARRRVC